ncbi:MAG: cobalamin-dependent protein [Chloroflexota bacterium]
MTTSVAWFADVLLSDRPTAARVAVQTLLAGGRDPRSIYIDVLAPALEEVGVRWARGQITIAQEHLATTVVSSIMDALAPQLARGQTLPHSIALAGTSGELHVVGLDMVEDFLAGDGWETYNFGAATPAQGFVEFVAAIGADAVGLSTTLTTHLRAAEETIAALRLLERPPFIIVGGQAYGDSDAVARAIGADAYARDARAASAGLGHHLSSIGARRDAELP